MKNLKILVPIWIITLVMLIVSIFYNNPEVGAKWFVFGGISTLLVYILGNKKKK